MDYGVPMSPDQVLHPETTDIQHVRSKYIPGWVNDSVIAAKETKRLFERLWRKNKSSFNRSQYMKKVHMYNKICMKAKSDFLKSRIHDNQDNPQKL